MWRSTLAIAAGDVDGAERLIGAFVAIGRRTGDRNALLYEEIQRFVLAMMGVGEPPPTGAFDRERDRPADYAYRAGYAWFLAGAGAADQARELVAWVAADDYARLGDDMNRLAALGELSRTMLLLQDATFASGAYNRLAPYEDRNIVNARGAGGYGSAALHLGELAALLGRREQAVAHLERAVERNAAMGATAWAQRAREALDGLRG
jgi:tetratricopeptide (TPR) repeat protein